MSGVHDDLATLRRIVNNVPFNPNDGHAALDRVEAEVALLRDGLRETKAALDRERGGGSPLDRTQYLALNRSVRDLLADDVAAHP